MQNVLFFMSSNFYYTFVKEIETFNITTRFIKYYLHLNINVYFIKYKLLFLLHTFEFFVQMKVGFGHNLDCAILWYFITALKMQYLKTAIPKIPLGPISKYITIAILLNSEK